MTRDELYRALIAERFGEVPFDEAATQPRVTARPPVLRTRTELERAARRCGLGREQIKALLRLPAGRAAQILAVRERRQR